MGYACHCHAHVEGKAPSLHVPYMDDFTPEDIKDALLDEILFEEHPDDRMYVYWLFNGEKITPAILKNVTPFPGLHSFLQTEFGQQECHVMISRKKPMTWSGIIRIGVPLVFAPRKDIHAEIEKLRRAERRKIAQR